MKFNHGKHYEAQEGVDESMEQEIQETPDVTIEIYLGERDEMQEEKEELPTENNEPKSDEKLEGLWKNSFNNSRRIP